MAQTNKSGNLKSIPPRQNNSSVGTPLREPVKNCIHGYIEMREKARGPFCLQLFSI
jgi:hypothetical protein